CRPFLMLLEKPDTDGNKSYRPQTRNAMEIEHVEITQEVKSSDNDQRDATPQFSVFHRSELLLQSVDGRFKANALAAKHSFLCRVIGFKGHIEIERRCGQRKQRRIRRIRQRNERSKNQNVDCCFDKFAVVDGPDSGNQAEREGRAWVVSCDVVELF